MEYYCITDIGLLRSKNQDSYLLINNAYGDFLAIVADGIGGGLAGEVASSKVVEYFKAIFKESGPFEDIDDIKNYLKLHINKANQLVYDLANSNLKYTGMGTTITLVLLSKFGYVVANAGDSRVYGILGEDLFHLTKDNTLVNKMLDNNEITYEEAINHPKKHYLVKAVGMFRYLDADVHQVKPMDYFLLSSDGLHSYVSEEEIISIIKKNISVKDKVIELKDLALLKGGYDNVTVILLKV